MEEFKNENLLKEIKPKFNFVYELFMPTGRKMKSALVMIIISIAITIFVLLNKPSMLEFSTTIIGKFNMLDILIFVCYFMIAFSIIKFFIHITFQKMQYEHISYKFYESYMVYEDDFLNQHKKNILYSNIKEVEIRRTIWDRILGMGVIVIYTNAENKRNNGIVVYALDNPKADYEFIDKIINKYRVQGIKHNNTINKKEEDKEIMQDTFEKEKNEQSFKDSLKETN